MMLTYNYAPEFVIVAVRKLDELHIYNKISLFAKTKI